MKTDSRNEASVRSPLAGVLVGGLVLVVALYAYVLIRWPDNFFADDSYFYFQVAWNLARGMGSTFNNVMPTNGYHPLWMVICTLIFKIFPAKETAIHWIGVVISLLDAGALFLLAKLLRRNAPDTIWWLSFLVYVPFAFLTQLGTEGALSGFCLAALMLSAYCLITAPERLAGALFALSAATAVLSRLDNIFIVAFTYAAAFLMSPRENRPAVRRLLLLFLPVCIVAWAGYVTSNIVWFGTIQPISGMLKAHSQHHAIFSNIPHVGQAALLIILPCILIEAWQQRDAFFRCVELPFTAGVLVHAVYISLVMSDETRWTWYYTSWALLASVLLSRVGSNLLRKYSSPKLVAALPVVVLVLLTAFWYKGAYRRFGHDIPEGRGVGYQENIVDKGLHVVLAYDKPGRAAYYTTARIIALDGLMGDLKFQHDLATRGIAAFDAENKVDGFLGPPQPFDAKDRDHFCEKLYLSSLTFHCTEIAPGQWQPTSVTIYARLGIIPAGTLELKRENLVANMPRDVALWKLDDPRP